MWSRLLAMLLVLAVWPALGETVESVAHLAEHGDLAHDRDVHQDTAPLGTDEHGCSGMFHLCSTGQVSAASPPRTTVRLSGPSRVSLIAVAAPLDAGGRDQPAPPVRPPIA